MTRIQSDVSMGAYTHVYAYVKNIAIYSHILT